MPAASGEFATSRSPEALAAAHARLLKDSSLQFDFHTVPPPPQVRLPEWLQAIFKSIGKLFGAVFQGVAPAMTAIFWVGVALVVALVVFLIVREVWGSRIGWRRKPRPQRIQPVDWRPEAHKARALLEDADRLAAEGAYDEAIHLILYRSIDDIEGRRPRLVRPALTARDIAALEAVPAAAREAFIRIAYLVEGSFFGGRKVGRDDYAACRGAYEAFAFPEAWA